MSFHEIDLPDPFAPRAFTIINGFCSLDCQDKFMVSLLVTAQDRIGEHHKMPVTSSQDVWEKLPFCQHFFHSDCCAYERFRGWIFQHNDVPTEFPVMSTYHQWTPRDYHLLRINDKDVFRRHLKLKYSTEDHDHDGHPCKCLHDEKAAVCSAYDLYEYKYLECEQSSSSLFVYEQSTLFCLTYDAGDSFETPSLERLLTVKNVFDVKEKYTQLSPKRMDDSGDDEGSEEEETPTPKKPASSKKRANEAAPTTPVSSKKAKAAVTPQKTEEKEKGGPATPHPAKKGGKTPHNRNPEPKVG